MRNLEIKNIDCHTALAMTKNGQTDVLQCGRSMIEMLGVLAIIGVLSVGGIAGYSKAMQKYRINKTIEQITQITTNTRTFFAPQKNYNDFECTLGGLEESDAKYKILKKAKIIPEEMWGDCYGSKKCVMNIFGGMYELEYEPKNENEIDGPYYTAFSLYLTELPQEVCIELGSLDWGNVAGSGLLKVSVNRIEATNIPMPIDAAVSACNCDNNCTLYLIYE